MDNNLVGQTIQGRYYVVKQLSRGGVGITFLAYDRQCFDAPCVVKQLKPQTTNARTLAIARRLFNREAEIMNRLGDCDRIPRLLAYLEENGEFFLVQELIEGHDLSQEIIAGRPWSESKTIDLLQDVLEVLLTVQQHRVIHRDLKPSNLMRRRQDNKIVLIDFGSVKQVSTQIIDAAGQIKQTVAVGTKTYMPMEQTMGHPGFYSDIYALGVIAIQALTGIEPKKLAIDDRGEIMWRNRLDPRINYQPRLLAILDNMVRYRFQERSASAAIVLSELKQLDVANNHATSAAVTSRSVVALQSREPLEANAEIATAIAPPATMMPAIEQKANPTDAIELARSSEPALVVQSRKKSKSVKFTAAIALPLLLAVALGGWLVIQPTIKKPQAELSVYQNSSLGFQVKYPQVWSKQNRNDFFTEGILFLSPLKNNTDRFQESVSILVENPPQDTSLAEYTEQSVAEIKQLSVLNVREAWSASLGGHPARQIVYSGSVNGTSVQRMQTWAIKNNRAYVVTYTALPETYNSYLPTVEKMMKSLKLVN